MDVLFAPDYRAGNPYQTLLAQHLNETGCNVSFLSTYKRAFPLARAVANSDHDILHLHWPEAYFSNGNGIGRLLRELRFPFDLQLAQRTKRLVLTAHNLFPHNAGIRPLVRRNIGKTVRLADTVIAHSHGAKTKIVDTFGIASEKVAVIPHGDLADGMPKLASKSEARARLGIKNELPICLMLGRVEPYKGIEETIDWWQKNRPEIQLFVVGACPNPAYAQNLQQKVTMPTITLSLNRCDEAVLLDYFSAADAALFNYTEILTSGSACLARSLGVPILIPALLDTVDLDEPNTAVVRFDSLSSDFAQHLAATVRLPRQDESAAEWRTATAWKAVAKLHHDVYRSL